MKTITVSPNFQVTIPRDMRDAMCIRPGQSIRAVQHRDRIELFPLPPMRKFRGMFKGIDTNVREAMTTPIEHEGSYVPRTELGRRLIELRNKGIRGGMKLLTRSEINEEVASLRGGTCE